MSALKSTKMKTAIQHTLGALAICVSLTGCMSMQSGSTLDQISGVLSSNEPFVEAYFEYPGPNERWAGPRSFVLHVLAKEGENAKVEILSKSAESPFDAVAKRTVAGAPAELKKLPRDIARDLIGNFATALSPTAEADTAHVGCVHPVRIRLIKLGGALIEKQGCRGVGQWTRAASELVAYLVTTERYGYTERVDSTRTPASVVGAATDEAGAKQETPAQVALKVEIERVPTGVEALSGARVIASDPKPSEHGAHDVTKSPTH